jgi:hypothetical protein
VTIEKGRPWGAPGTLAADGVVVRTDAELRHLVEDALSHGRTPPMVGLLGGDLCRTVGGRGGEERLHGPDAVRLPVDVGTVRVDGAARHWFVAHLVARRSWWSGRVVAVMNAQWIGRWDVAPRSHPNDGLLDVFDADLELDDRLKARPRLLTGTHVPHPGIRQQRAAEVAITLDRPTPLHLDGERVGTATTLEITVVPGAVTCVV